MNIEVEIRARVDGFNKIKEVLEKIGANFVKSENQTDKIFGAAKFLDSEHKIIEGGIVARIREANGKSALEFKEILREKGGIELNCPIASIEIGEKMLKKLDFEESFTIKKNRETYSYNDFKICLDKVEQLGSFVEIEKETTSEREIEETRKECLNLLEKIVPGAKTENRRYGDLMQELINQRK
jgi:adenylate cyclase class 2